MNKMIKHNEHLMGVYGIQNTETRAMYVGCDYTIT
jgi:hypothetical protein